MNTHEQYMQRCLQLAANGLGTTYPNPLVGCVIISDTDRILGEGWHYQSGKPHAEVNAINSAIHAGYSLSDFKKATLYVSLEPCSHHGKTPPCADVVVKSGFKNVVIGTLDPHDKVAGMGVKRLQENGIVVTVGVLPNACNELNKRFFTYHRKSRPYILLKWAQCANGCIAPAQKDTVAPVWITNTYSRQLAHKLRANEQAILIGARTALADNPSLTTRDWHGTNPVRIVLSNAALPDNLAVYNKDAQTHTFTTSEPAQVCKQLYELEIQSVIIEGGTATLQSFIDANLWDEAVVFKSTAVRFEKGIPAPKWNASPAITALESVQYDNLTHYKNA